MLNVCYIIFFCVWNKTTSILFSITRPQRFISLETVGTSFLLEPSTVTSIFWHFMSLFRLKFLVIGKLLKRRKTISITYYVAISNYWIHIAVSNYWIYSAVSNYWIYIVYREFIFLNLYADPIKIICQNIVVYCIWMCRTQLCYINSSIILCFNFPVKPILWICELIIKYFLNSNAKLVLNKIL